VIGTAGGPLETHASVLAAHGADGRRGVPARYPASGSLSLAASLPAMRLGLRGPVITTAAACATFAYAVVAASHLLAAGDADLVLAGAVDTLLTPATIAGFANMRVLASDDDPARACRPLDRARRGLVMSEGGAILALERLEAATRRGAAVRAVLLGYGLTSDAAGVAAPDEAGIGRAAALALERAGVGAGEIDHLNLHAAGTPRGDLAEARALREVLGRRTAEITATAPKSMLGHAMGAASGVETAVLVRSLETGMVPPTLNLDEMDPEIALDATPVARAAPMRTALKTSSGIGGLNAALVLGARR
jgi:3-oxoacyl-[acyl-carrier-protein] synthase II